MKETDYEEKEKQRKMKLEEKMSKEKEELKRLTTIPTLPEIEKHTEDTREEWSKMLEYKSIFDKIRYETHFFIRSIVGFPRKAYRKIKSFIQRGIRGWSDEDAWDLHWYLSEVISESVHHLRKTVHGYPCDLEGPEEWDDILSKIEMAFRLASDEECYYIPVSTGDEEEWKYIENKEVEGKTDEGFRLFKEYFFHLWD